MLCSSVAEIISNMRYYKATNKNADFIVCDDPQQMLIGFGELQDSEVNWEIRLSNLKIDKLSYLFNSGDARAFVALVLTTENPDVKTDNRKVMFGDCVDFQRSPNSNVMHCVNSLQKNGRN